MKKNFSLWFILALALGMLFLSGCNAAPAAPAAPAPGGSAPALTFYNILTMQHFVHWGIINAPADPIEGFVKLLLFVVLLLVGHRLLRLVPGVGDLLGVAISAAVSLVLVIFVPVEAIIASATGGGLILSIVLMAIPLAACALAYFFIENRWVRVGIIGLLIVAMHWMEAQMGRLGAGVPVGITNAGITAVQATLFHWAVYTAL